MIILLVLIVAFPTIMSYISSVNIVGSSNSQVTSTFQVGIGGGTISQNPSIFNSSMFISYPSAYATLSNFSLSLINNDRNSFGLGPVSLASIPSGQQHADSMLKYGYFSHWDVQGLKPYMRYSVLGGNGFVEENVAYEFTSLPTILSVSSVERAITNLEHQMVYNDSACCQNGHRDNILNKFHNQVSIGIAYNSTDVFFVEDFITNYAGINLPVTQGSDTINFVGTTSQSLNPNSIQVFYDKTPSNLSVSTIESSYNGPYDQGTFIGGILPPCQSLFSCPAYQGAITVQASTWNVASSNIDISFSLSNFIGKYGNGVYTLYLTQGNQNNLEYLTSISIFVSSTTSSA